MTLLGSTITADIGSELGSFFTITSIGTLVSNVVGAALTVASLGVVIFFVWGAIQWLMSGGDKAKVEAAKNRISNALVGLTLVAVSWAVYATVDYLLDLPVGVYLGGGTGGDGVPTGDGGVPGTGDCDCGCGGGGYAASGAIGAANPYCYVCTGSSWVRNEDLTYPDDCPSITCFIDCI